MSRKGATAVLVDALSRKVLRQVLPAGLGPHMLLLRLVATGVFALHLQTEAGMVVKKRVVE